MFLSSSDHLTLEMGSCFSVHTDEKNNHIVYSSPIYDVIGYFIFAILSTWDPVQKWFYFNISVDKHFFVNHLNFSTLLYLNVTRPNTEII